MIQVENDLLYNKFHKKKKSHTGDLKNNKIVSWFDTKPSYRLSVCAVADQTGPATRKCEDVSNNGI